MKVKDTRCGKCQRFAEHTCSRNDLYLTPEKQVADDFAVKCNVFEQKERREALVSAHQNEVVGSLQERDAQSGVKSPPLSALKKGKLTVK